MVKNGTPISYREAGVDIDNGDALVSEIGELVKKTRRPELLNSLGGYAGLFSLNLKKYPDPVLVSTTDGVGTKLKIAFELKKFDSVGIDLVAMCVNDLICCGAEPLFFLDYFATGSLDVETAKSVIKGMAECLATINCTLIGGETAEMPGLYAKGEFDLAGFAVGVVNKNKIIDGSTVCEGDTLIGISSSGIHSNGFSLVRKILEKNNIDLTKDKCGFDVPLGQILLTPTLIYVNAVQDLLTKFNLKAMAHITGGGLMENIPRVLPKNISACIEKNKIKTPKIFKLLQKMGQVEEKEMWRVFNMGIGYALVVSPEQKNDVLEHLTKAGWQASDIGYMVKSNKDESGAHLV